MSTTTTTHRMYSRTTTTTQTTMTMMIQSITIIFLFTTIALYDPIQGYTFTSTPNSKQWGSTTTTTKTKTTTPRLIMKEKSSENTSSSKKFGISSLFKRKNKQTTKSDEILPNLRTTTTSSDTTTLSSPSHPSVRDHISPLNLLVPDRKSTQASEALLLPMHPDVTSGVLENGLSYVILPNKSPPGRFEAHLQVFSGSADELEPQQGIAHLTEHVAYMGSRKRERLFGTGSQTNAYTDFHHTVFYAACPTYIPTSSSSKKKQQPMLPMALDALCDVMRARVEPSRLEKERSAVLSEMTMVNTIEYRIECQILSTLHRENRLAKRFPIGKEILIRNWKVDDVKTWHRTHYRPDNVLLYLVGDFEYDDNVEEVKDVIQDRFGGLSAEKQGEEIRIEELKVEASMLADAVVGRTVKAKQSWHYPPVRHDWCVERRDYDVDEDGKLSLLFDDGSSGGGGVGEYDLHLQDDYPLDEKVDFMNVKHLNAHKSIRPHIFKHELLQSFSLHLFAKRPVEPITTLHTLRKSLSRRIALAALQIRLNVHGRSDDPPFTFVEFNQLDSSREGCAVCSLDMTSEYNRWDEAIMSAIKEVKRLGRHGVTKGEVERYASALVSDAEQLAAQGDRIGHGDQLAYLMETVGNGHVFMSPQQSLEMTLEALRSLGVEEVNDAARELCGHVIGLGEDDDDDLEGLVVVVACFPKEDGAEGDAIECNEETLVNTIIEACRMDVEPVKDVTVPHSLVTKDDIDIATREYPPTWLGGSFTDGTPNTPPDKLTRPFTLRRLGNGIRIGVARNDAESQRGHLRIIAPGGRQAESLHNFKPGSMSVGARAMQEGGAFGPWSREQVELFCVDHLIMVEINCNEESLFMDFTFPTTNVGNVGFGDNRVLGITGTEAVLQIVREIVVGFQWEEDALGRSKTGFRAAHEGLQKNLEGKSTEVIMEAMTGNDPRFLSINVETVNSITLQDAKTAVMSQLQPSKLEISIAGDFIAADVLQMIHTYLGTIPPDVNSQYLPSSSQEEEIDPFGSVPKLSLPGKHVDLELTDSDPRAVAYVAGSAPNLWGYLADGTTVAHHVTTAHENNKRSSGGSKPTDYDRQRRAHPLFANVALSLLSEIANRRLFSTVREKKQLTYDANFSLTGFERLKGGWFLVTVTASKEKAQQALDACKETLDAMRTSNPISIDNLESAKRVVLNRHEGDLRTSSYWATIMSGLQEESIPLKGPLSVTDFHAVVESITTQDLQLTLECLGLDEDELYTAIGMTVQPEGFVPSEIVKADPMAGMSRGGALRG